jgi:replication initiator protein RepSA
MTAVTEETRDFTDWERQISTAGACSHPIRLRGTITAVDLATGELAPVYDTGSEPGGVLHVACGNRREAVCPACSATYKRDARQLVRSGLVGGKGIPGTVAEHPCVFATLTAPSFGPVHARRERGGKVLPCRPRRDKNRRACPHGRDISCPVRHAPEDPRLGRPMCPDCYNYQAAVLFNAHSGSLWRRFTTYLPRHLARLAGVTQKQLRAEIRIRYVKVAEYQARGVVHFHAIIRLDADTGNDGPLLPPPHRWTADLLAVAIKAAAAAATTRVNVDQAHALTLRFGAQTDTRPVRTGTTNALSRDAVANYIAKYATKSAADAPGLPATRIRDNFELASLHCPPHYRRMIETAWHLGHRQWAHTLGYGGHFLTKSRRYSVTFGELRTARRDHRRAQRHPNGELDPWGREIDETTVLILTEWSYAGSGYQAADAHRLALMSADKARSRGH